MGPPALPASRAGRGGFMPRSRAFERSRSDAQVEELLAQGTHMMGVDPRGGLAAHPNSSGFSSRHAVSPDADDSDEEELIPRIPAQARVLGPSERHSEGLPTLRELCMSRLLGAAEPDSPSGSRRSGRQLMLLETYDNGALRDLRYDLDSEIVRKLEAARRSATDTWGDRPSLSGGMRKSHGGSWCSGAGLRSSGPDAEMNGADVEAELDEGDDASQNPWYGRCPNPRHGSGKPSELDWPVAVEEASRAPIFVTPAETRMEWVSHVAGCQVGPEVPRLLKRAQAQKVLLGAPQSFGASAQSSSQRASVSPAVEDETLLDSGGLLPILWKGCRPGCLDFLESGVAATRTGL